MMTKKNSKFWQIREQYLLAKSEHLRLARDLSLEEQQNEGRYYSNSGIKIDIPFVPSSDKKIAVMMEFAGDIREKHIADLGSGSGKILVALARKGAIVDGYELEPELIDEAFEKLKKEKLGANIYQQNFFEADLSQYDGFTIYGITSMMDKLERKLDSEMKKDSFLISNTFVLPTWLIEKEHDGIYLYRRK